MDRIYVDLLKDLIHEKITALGFKSSTLINAFNRSGYSCDDENYTLLQADLAKIEDKIAVYQLLITEIDNCQNIIGQKVHKYIMFLLAREVDTVEDEINEWELQIYPDHFEAERTYKILNDESRSEQNKLIKHRRFINRSLLFFDKIEYKIKK